jgi:hypothetical protein
MKYYDTDWQGNPLPDNEDDNSVITIWVLSGFSASLDEIWIRSYQAMTRYTTAALVESLDAAEEEDLKHQGKIFNVRLRNVKKFEYDEVVGSDDYDC